MTAQAHEQLIFEGQASSMAFCPPLPYDHPRVMAVELDGSDRAASYYSSTACWRGYIGTWEVRDGCFYLVDLKGRFALVGDEPLLAEWFTGVIRIPKGKRIRYVHMGFASVYEWEVQIKISNGRTVGSRLVDNRKKLHDDPRRDGLPGRENLFDGDDGNW